MFHPLLVILTGYPQDHLTVQLDTVLSHVLVPEQNMRQILNGSTLKLIKAGHYGRVG